MFKMWKIGIWIFLLIGTIWDIKKREIPVLYLMVGTGISVVSQIIHPSVVWYECLLGAVIGVLFLVLSRLTQEQIGYGDSWMIFNLGICLGSWKLLVLLGLMFGTCFIFTVIGCARKKIHRKERVALYPFLMLGYMGVMLW